MASLCTGVILWLTYVGCVVYYQGNFRHSFVPLPELICIFLLLHFLNYGNKHRLIRYIGRVLSFVFIFSFLVQCFYYANAGEFISVLALENVDQAYVLIQPKYILILGLLLIIYILYIKYSERKSSCMDKYHHKIFPVGLLGISIFLVISQNGFFSKDIKFLNRLHLPKNPTPVVELGVNMKKTFFPSNIYANGLDGYPFIKSWVYKQNLPFNKKSNFIQKPNIIVVFTEGTSARLLDCYGGKFPNLTPNIDDFAASSMLVKNYYNHTTATFRGTHGQLSSCYPRKGGNEAGGWVITGQSSILSKRKYQTLPNVLNKDDYSTTFFSPHATKDPYTDLANMLGFSNVYTRDTIDSLLGYKPVEFQESIKDKDMYHAVIRFLDSQSDSGKPFMLSLYTLDTHAGLDIPDDGIPYDLDGKKNSSLNTLHNLDNAFGEFWNWFKQSKYKENTIVIFTADHAHFYEKPYTDLVGNDPDYKRCFIDKIPLIIYDPTHELPKDYDANDSTSLDLTPTILHLLGINDVDNSFMGSSLFDSSVESTKVSVTAEGKLFHAIYNHHIFDEGQVEDNKKKEYNDQKDRIEKFYECEKENRVFFH